MARIRDAERVGRRVRVVGEVEHRVGQCLERRRRGRDVEPAELRHAHPSARAPVGRPHRRRSRHRWRTPRGGRRVDGQFHRGRVGGRAADGADPEPGRTGQLPPTSGSGPRRGRWRARSPERRWRLPASRLAASTTTSTSTATSVWFWTTTGSSNESPKFRKRGADGRTISGRRAVMLASAVPNCWAPVGGDDHHPVAGEVVGERHVDRGVCRRRPVVTSGPNSGEGVEVRCAPRSAVATRTLDRRTPTEASAPAMSPSPASSPARPPVPAAAVLAPPRASRRRRLAPRCLRGARRDRRARCYRGRTALRARSAGRRRTTMGSASSYPLRASTASSTTITAGRRRRPVPVRCGRPARRALSRRRV